MVQRTWRIEKALFSTNDGRCFQSLMFFERFRFIVHRCLLWFPNIIQLQAKKSAKRSHDDAPFLPWIHSRCIEKAANNANQSSKRPEGSTMQVEIAIKTKRVICEVRHYAIPFHASRQNHETSTRLSPFLLIKRFALAESLDCSTCMTEFIYPSSKQHPPSTISNHNQQLLFWSWSHEVLVPEVNLSVPPPKFNH
jgi:hypothetical protein